MDYVSHLTRKKIVPVGPLVRDPIDEEEEAEQIIEWLDKKQRSSTVFVSFGTEYFLSNEETKEIAHGLELSKVNFVWVIRFHMGDENSIEKALPIGFSIGLERGVW